MTFLLSRARRLFFYGNLDAHGSGGGSNGILGSEEASSLDGRSNNSNHVNQIGLTKMIARFVIYLLGTCITR